MPQDGSQRKGPGMDRTGNHEFFYPAGNLLMIRLHFSMHGHILVMFAQHLGITFLYQLGAVWGCQVSRVKQTPGA